MWVTEPGVLPIWVSASELECCQPDAIVDRRWDVRGLILERVDSAPAEDPARLSADTAGRFDGNVIFVKQLDANRCLLRIHGSVLLICESPVDQTSRRLTGRLRLGSHELEFQGEAMRCQGIVRRIRLVQKALLDSDEDNPDLDTRASTDIRSTTEREPGDELLVELQLTTTMLA